MLRTFNCGIGMVVVVARSEADAVVRCFTGLGEPLIELGRIVADAASHVAIQGAFAA